ncbi:unnamed protein product [Polarella glacialis]|uniref:Uncharacterized protein n=1 Tax=Polarella glacialis TaxID=89957 RepID=A0A813EEV9_POLGL|nr:unnamed protein product [Polarella glacialis]
MGRHILRSNRQAMIKNTACPVSGCSRLLHCTWAEAITEQLQNMTMAAGTSTSKSDNVVPTSARHTSSVGTVKLSESISAATRHSLELNRGSVLDFKLTLEALSFGNAVSDRRQHHAGGLHL